jgi:hypothetical protein
MGSASLFWGFLLKGCSFRGVVSLMIPPAGFWALPSLGMFLSPLLSEQQLKKGLSSILTGVQAEGDGGRIDGQRTGVSVMLFGPCLDFC